MKLISRASLLAVLAATAAVFGAPHTRRAPVSQLESDLRSLSGQVDAVNGDLEGFSGTIMQGVVIYQNTNQLSYLLDNASEHVKATPNLSEAEADKLMDLVEATRPGIQKALSVIVDKKTSFDKLGVTTVVKTLVSKLGSGTKTLAADLVAVVPVSRKDRAAGIERDFFAEWSAAEK
ncbi:hydrophobic surface binding protein A-domain-containing protein, partial [Crassisporium funariophilum]